MDYANKPTENTYKLFLEATIFLITFFFLLKNGIPSTTKRNANFLTQPLSKPQSKDLKYGFHANDLY